MKTFIRWQGNKLQHINKFIKYIPEFNGCYIEPFLGSGALFLKIQPKKWLINDLNKDLISVWKYIQTEPLKIINFFKNFEKKFVPLSNNDKVIYCKKITSNIQNLPFTLKRTCYYILMKYCCYSGSIEVRNKFFFEGLSMNIYMKNYYPFFTENYFNNVKQISSYLNDTIGTICNTSYENILNKAKQGDFVFLDPPYIESHNYKFNYNINEVLDKNFLSNLLKEVEKLDKKKVKWLMTQADTNEVKKIFKKYTIKKYKVFRMASKSYVNELIIMNY
jgi:DNA adenine methylase